MYWRKETYGLRTPKRFKITNYGPAIEVMLENDPNANLNREVPVTPTKPKPATQCQKFIARVLPELQISCFEIKSKDWQAIGELQGSDLKSVIKGDSYQAEWSACSRCFMIR